VLASNTPLSSSYKYFTPRAGFGREISVRPSVHVSELVELLTHCSLNFLRQGF